uniref:DUF834 domain-containing protein n=1 Tax=Macrostomum lignano TaxID=282301 RepID=A0A1I8F9C0_9PLAT
PGSSPRAECLTLSKLRAVPGGGSRFGRVSSLAGWDPWTNSRAQPAATPSPASAGAAVSAIYSGALQRRPSDHRHHPPDQRDGTSGGILDANFVIDTQSSNTELSRAARTAARTRRGRRLQPAATTGGGLTRRARLAAAAGLAGLQGQAADGLGFSDAGIGDKRNQPQQKQKIRGGEVQSDDRSARRWPGARRGGGEEQSAWRRGWRRAVEAVEAWRRIGGAAVAAAVGAAERA